MSARAGISDRSTAYASARASSPDPSLLAALAGTDASQARAVTQRTRRAVFSALDHMDAERSNQRRGTMLVVLMGFGLLMALSPALWNTVDEMLGGEFPLDVPGMIGALTFTLFAAVAAVLCWVGMQGGKRRLIQPRR